MSSVAIEQTEISEPAGTHGMLSATDLAELMASFNEVTGKLERTHAQLRGEVRRLSDELREANEALQRSKRLAALGEMAAGIAHEVRNPLGSIGLYARMLEQDLDDRPECRGVAEKIGSAVRGLDAVVGDVLTFSKELRIRPCPGVPSELLRRAAEGCKAELDGLDVDIDVADDSEFEHDPGLLHQALINVVRNACDASRASGGSSIRLSARRGMVDPDGVDPVPGIVLAVRDQGDGFDAESIERVFNPFFTTRAVGTGLGLPIVHRIIDAHGGSIAVFNNVENRPGVRPHQSDYSGHDGRGATVELRLPLRVAGVSPCVVIRSGTPRSGATPEQASVCEESL